MKKIYKNGRAAYKGERWKILVSEDGGKTWRFHSDYSHSCFRDEELKKLKS